MNLQLKNLNQQLQKLKKDLIDLDLIKQKSFFTILLKDIMTSCLSEIISKKKDLEVLIYKNINDWYLKDFHKSLPLTISSFALTEDWEKSNISFGYELRAYKDITHRTINFHIFPVFDISYNIQPELHIPLNKINNKDHLVHRFIPDQNLPTVTPFTPSIFSTPTTQIAESNRTPFYMIQVDYTNTKQLKLYLRTAFILGISIKN